MNIHRNEITTGILVLSTLALVVGMLILVGMPGLIKPLNTHRIYYDNAKGIRPGAPVLLAGREIGKVTALDSPVPVEERPEGHPDYEVVIDVQVTRDAAIYKKVTVQLAQQGLMGQQVIDFLQGDPSSGLADDQTEFVGQRVPDIAESMGEHMKRLTGPESDLAMTVKNARSFMETLNNSKVEEVISNTAEFTDVLKREPWRLIWPSKTASEDWKPAEDPRREKDREEVNNLKEDNGERKEPVKEKRPRQTPNENSGSPNRR
jgi:ABC-type transporter Mla subunit MlaD